MAIPNPNPNIADGVKCDNKTYSSNKIESLISTATELPIPEEGDAGKVLTVDDELGYELAAIPTELPTPATGDAGKVLTVNAGEDGYELKAPVDYSNDIEAVDDKLDYSSDETEVGTWIDGKTIYRKVVSIGALGDAAETDTPVFDNGYVDTLISMKAFASNSIGITLPLPYAYPGNTTSAIGLIWKYLTTPAKWGVTCTTGSDRSEYTGTVILEYTKAD